MKNLLGSLLTKIKTRNSLIFFLSTFNKDDYYCVFSINYWPLISSVCQTLNLPYISWCYDAPLNVRNVEDTLGNENNRVYLFDREQYSSYRKLGFNTVYHLPLGINSKRLSRIQQYHSNSRLYKCDVSFVGQLYETPLNEIINLCDEYIKGYLTSIISIQQNVYGEYLIDKVLNSEILSRINENIRSHSTYFPRITKQELSFTIASEITRRERLILLSLCGLHYNTKFFSHNKNDFLENVIQCPPVDYISEMPYVFRASKINLSPSLRAIRSGIPLRALDIMACGGFLLSNYQEEFLDYFTIDHDIVLYESIEDAIEKIDFYLNKEEERSKIIERSQQKTLSQFDMKDRLIYMIKKNIEP